jgi:hypothetical protein
MNKFEALKIFQAWPPEWQRLCAECWIETGEVDPKFVLAFPKQTVGELAQRGVSMPSDQPKTVLTYPREAAKAAAVKKRKHHSKQAWSTAESEYLLKLASEDQPLWNVVAFFLSRYPGRSRDAVRRRVWGVRSGKPESEVKY